MAAPQVAPPAPSRTVCPAAKGATGNCCDELLTPEASGLTLLKTYSQYLLRSAIAALVLFCSIINSLPVILISTSDRPSGAAIAGGAAAATIFDHDGMIPKSIS